MRSPGGRTRTTRRHRNQKSGSGDPRPTRRSTSSPIDRTVNRLRILAAVYKWVVFDGLTDAPCWLLDALAPLRSVSSSVGPSAAQPIRNKEAYAKRTMEAVAGRIRTAQDGEKHTVLASAAFTVGKLCALPGASIEEGRQFLVDEIDRAWSGRMENRDAALKTIDDQFGLGLANGHVEETQLSAATTANDDAGEPWALGAMPFRDFAAVEHPEPERIVGPFIKGTVPLVYGSAGSMKSWFAMEVMRQAAERGHVCVYVLEEGHPFYMKRRLVGLGIDPDRLHMVMRRGVQLDDPKKLDALIAYAQGVGAGLICLDPLSDLHTLDENDRTQMLTLRRAIERLASETGACVMLMHHSSKAGGRQGKMDLGADMANARGSSVLQGAFDLLLELRRDPDELNRIEVHTTKNRYEAMEVPGSLTLAVDETTKPWTVTATWVHGDEAKAEYEKKKAEREERRADKARKADGLADAILAEVSRKPGCSKSHVENALHPVHSKSTTRRRIESLLSERKLVDRGTAPNYALHVGGRAMAEREELPLGEPTGPVPTPTNAPRCMQFVPGQGQCAGAPLPGNAWCRLHYDAQLSGGNAAGRAAAAPENGPLWRAPTE